MYRKRVFNKIFYISKMLFILVIALVVPVIGVFKFREYDYQRKQAIIIQDFLERKGMYATSTNLSEVTDITILVEGGGTFVGETTTPTPMNVIVESSGGFVSATPTIEIDDTPMGVEETPIPIPTLAPTPTQAPIINDYAIVEGDIMTLTSTFKITYYCPCKKCCGNYSYEVTGVMNKTSSGTTPVAGRTIAVCTDQIPLGTTVIIDGHEYIAEDTGGAIKWDRIDIYCDTHQEALNNGVKHTQVSIKR